tara:strand:- start:656 stop:1957 length:1302 start_codon:yes stop_codon:yes gene_type:complete
MLALTALYTLGVCTPVIGFLLVVSICGFDHFLFSSIMLPTQVSFLCLTYFLLLNAGSRFSLDALISKRYPKSLLGRFIKYLYSGIGNGGRRWITTLYFFWFLSYGLGCLGAAILHLYAEHWKDGSIVGLISTDPMFFRVGYELMSGFRDTFPQLFAIYSQTATYLQLGWELLMIPLVFFRGGRIFVIFQGLLFFLIALGMYLKDLPIVELIMWTALFLRRDHTLWIGAFLRFPTPRNLTDQVSGNLTSLTLRKPISQGVVYILTAYVLVYIAFLPFSRSFQIQTRKIRPLLQYAGIDYPNVFNQRVRNLIYYNVIYRTNEDGSEQLAPFFTPDGKKMFYLTSNLLYFGHSRLKLFFSVYYDYKRKGIGDAVGYRYDTFVSSVLTGECTKIGSGTITIHGKNINFQNVKGTDPRQLNIAGNLDFETLPESVQTF